MDLINLTNKLIKVEIDELEIKIRSKKNIYYILRQWYNIICIFLGQYYIPD